MVYAIEFNLRLYLYSGDWCGVIEGKGAAFVYRER